MKLSAALEQIQERTGEQLVIDESDRSLYMWNVAGQELELLAIDEEGTFDDGRAYAIVWVQNRTERRRHKVLINKDHPRRQILQLFGACPHATFERTTFRKVRPEGKTYARWELVDFEEVAPESLKLVN